MIKLIIFDLDDTLMSEEEYVKSGYKEVAKTISKKYLLNPQIVFSELLELFYAKEKNVFNKLLDKYKLEYTDKEICDLVNIYRNHKPQICFFEDVYTFIEKAKEKDIYLGIITDGNVETQKRKLEVLNAYKIFDYIIITDELGKEYWKPNRKAYEMMMEKFNVKPEETIYIGDNPKKDFYIKKYIPIKTIRIKRENAIYLNEDYLEGIEADIIVKGLHQIVI